MSVKFNSKIKKFCFKTQDGDLLGFDTYAEAKKVENSQYGYGKIFKIDKEIIEKHKL